MFVFFERCLGLATRMLFKSHRNCLKSCHTKFSFETLSYTYNSSEARSIIYFLYLQLFKQSVVKWIELLLLKRYTRFDSRSRQTKKYINISIYIFHAGRSALKDSVKLPPCVVDKWVGGSLTQSPKSLFSVSCLRQLDK